MAREELDYKSLGLRVGLEIHVQLNTRRKLFCECPTRGSDHEAVEFARRLRPAKSELGEVDPAAILEWSKGRKFIYIAPSSSACLVEADEEPPHEIDRESVSVALAVATALHMRIVDEVHVMRKIVIDGSNVSGFQRTALIALNGYLEDGPKKIGIQTLCLEEDAARKVEEKGDSVVYNIDRLGVPLIEIATAPDIEEPEEALRAAFRLGQLVRLTGKAKRGLGSIRQDLNISVRGGAKVEIKGVQHLYLIPIVIRNEVSRQLGLIEIANELRRRGINKDALKFEVIDVSQALSSTRSKLVRTALERGGRAMAMKLTGFKGLLGKELQPGRRFGSELADYARVWAGVGGIIHSDELPGYGITDEEVRKVYEALGARPESDAFVVVLDEKEKAIKALRAVWERCLMALEGVPEETRAANPDGTTRYMRPRPGSARMYPETDIPPLRIDEALISAAMKLVPEPYEAKLERYLRVHGLSRELAEAVLNDLRLDLYEELVNKYGDRVPPSVIAATIVNTLRMLRGEGVDVSKIDDDDIEQVIALVAEGRIAKEAIPQVLSAVASTGKSVDEVVEGLGLTAIRVEDVEAIVETAMAKLADRIRARPDKAFQIVMSEVMKVLRGRVDGAKVAEIVREKLRALEADTAKGR
ncbi:MAG: Glu-tRNA(Gln) amidotransferase subunit GatE [Desulfurococcaceae archaeon]